MNGAGRIVGLLFGLAPFLMGCHREAEFVHIPGWVETKAAGVAFCLPPDMKLTDLSSGDLSEIQMRAKSQYPHQPELQRVVEQLASSGAIKLVAIAPDSNSVGFASRFNLIVVPVANYQKIEDIVAANGTQMSAVATPGSLVSDLKKFPAGKAAFFQFDQASAGGQHTQTTYFLIHDSKEFAFVFQSSVSDKKIWASVAEATMKSVHFYP